MSEPTPLPPPDDPLDQAASAVVDGTATDAERALVEASADGEARVRAFRRVADAVGTEPPEQDPSAADAAIAAALRADSSSSTPARNRRRRQARWLAPVGAAAAAVVVLLGIGALALRDDSDDGSTTAALENQSGTMFAADDSRSAAPPEAAADASGGAAGGGAASPAIAATTVPGAAAAVIDGGELGAVDDQSVLVERAKAAIEGETGSAPTTGAPSSQVAGCDRAIRSRAPSVGALRYQATATLQGTPVIVLAYDATDGATPPRILEVAAAEDCRRLTTARF